MPYKNKEQQLAYQRAWMKARRDSFFNDKSCVVCGSTQNLELDHVDKSSKVDHKVWSWTAARRNAELSKCQVLCNQCHLKKTVNENVVPIRHGTRDGYAHHGCRCVECKAASATYLKDWKMASSSNG